MVVTYLVYLGLTAFVTFSPLVSCKLKKNWHTYWLVGVFIPVLIVSIVLGGRWNVGTDWDEYRGYYNSIMTFGLTWTEILSNSLEPIYLLLNVFIATFNLSSSYFFTFIALLHFICYAFVYRRNWQILPLGFFFFMVFFLPLMLNIQRQTLAICVFFLSTFYIGKSAIKFFIGIVFAYFIHYSSIVLFPLFFVSKNIFSFLENRFLAIIFYVGSILLSGPLNTIVSIIFSMFVSNEKYIKNMEEVSIEMEVFSGLGIIASHIINLTIIMCSKKLCLSTALSSLNVHAIYRCFLIGCLSSNVFGLSMFLSRVSFALTSLKIILLPCLCYLLLTSRTSLASKFFAFGLILLSLSMFVASISNGAGGISPFTFYWV